MKYTIEGDLLIINSRLNMFWFELVLVINERIAENYGQFRSHEQAEEVRQQMLNEQK